MKAYRKEQLCYQNIFLDNASATFNLEEYMIGENGILLMGLLIIAVLSL